MNISPETPPNPNHADKIVVGTGKMAALVHSMDWSQTPLGPIENWPQSLKTTASLCLASNFPISIAWGPQWVQIYNDGYWPMCGDKHPTCIGLYMVKKMIDNAGGKIQVQSTINQGSTFQVYFSRSPA